MTPRTVEDIAIVSGCPLELKHKTLLLTSHTLGTGLGGIKLVLT